MTADIMHSVKLVTYVIGGVAQYRMGIPRPLIARWTRTRMTEMGPSFIKLGQMIACRPDIFPSDVVAEFTPLLTTVPSVAFADISKRVPTGIDVDPVPLATGSIAQVHRGTYGDKRIVIKIKKPGVTRGIRRDLRTMRGILSTTVGMVSGLRDVELFLEQFQLMITQETDFRKEVESMRAYQKHGNPMFKVPVVYGELCTPHAIVMEYCPGVTADDYSKQEADWRTKSTASILMNGYMHRLLTVGYFHADPHPGNIGIMNDGRIVLYDYGSVMMFDEPVRESLRCICACLVTGDNTGLVDELIRRNIIRPSDGKDAFSGEDVRQINTYVSAMARYIQTTDLNDIIKTIKPHESGTSSPFVFAPIFVLMLRAIAMLEGSCKTLDPDFSYVAALASLFLTDAGIKVLETRGERDIKWLISRLDISSSFSTSFF